MSVRIKILCSFAFFSTVVFSLCPARAAVVGVDAFESVHCPHCRKLKEEFFPAQALRHPELAIRYHDLGQPENYRLFVKVQEKFGRKTESLPENLPVIFIGDRVLTGEEEVRNDFEKLLKEELPGGSGFASEGISAAPAGQTRAAAIHLAYFYQPGCKECRTVEYLLKYLKAGYPNLEITEFDLSLRENKELEEAVCELLNVPERQRLLAPALFIGRHAFIKKISHSELESALGEYRLTGAGPVWEEAKSLIPRAREKIIERFHRIGIPAIIIAGFLDGINPCAFATIIFLIIYLTSLKRRKNEVLAAGMLFSTAVFITYFLLGLGLFGFVRRLSFIPFVRRTVFLLAAALTMFLAIMSFLDYLRARKGNAGEFILQLSPQAKARIRAAIARSSRKENYIIASLGLGVSVSLLEAACTGQVYLPTIVFVAGATSAKLRAVAYIFLYNLVFILPLVVVFSLTWMGVSSMMLTRIFQRHLGTTKLLLAALFLVFTIFLLYFTL